MLYIVANFAQIGLQQALRRRKVRKMAEIIAKTLLLNVTTR